jgi:hypothetical protein
MPITDELIKEACEHFGATEIKALKSGSQKSVRLVEIDGDLRVLKVIGVGGSDPQSLMRPPERWPCCSRSTAST